MFKKFATALTCAVAPAVLLAEPVELRSTDGFISVEGEIVGFNGVMLSVLTSVGLVSVPASEVICFGDGCLTTIATNDFGLTEDAFEGVETGAQAADTEPESGATGPDNLTVSFADPLFNRLFRTVAGAYSVAADQPVQVRTSTPGQITLESDDGSQVATLTFEGADDNADLVIDTTSLRGTEAAAHLGPLSWATADQVDHQLIGLKAFAVVVAPDLAIRSISLDELAGIYAGEITNWSALGGPDMNILPLQLPAGSLVREELINLVMEPAGKSIAGNVLTMADEAGIAASINQFPGSISMVSVVDAQDNLTVPVSGSCGIGVPPTEFNIISGDYPLVRPIMVRYETAPNTTLLTDLFDFASKPGSLNLTEGEGFFNQTARLQEAANKNLRLGQILGTELEEADRPVAAQMFETLFEADRLSPTMYGGATSGPEGGWNRSMFMNLQEVLKSGDYAGREIMFVGFAESDNGAQAAIDASVIAAADMQAAFGEFASDVVRDNNLRLASFGFGGVAPATCYGGQVSTDTHTRVEIWIR